MTLVIVPHTYWQIIFDFSAKTVPCVSELLYSVYGQPTLIIDWLIDWLNYLTRNVAKRLIQNRSLFHVVIPHLEIASRDVR